MKLLGEEQPPPDKVIQHRCRVAVAVVVVVVVCVNEQRSEGQTQKGLAGTTS